MTKIEIIHVPYRGTGPAMNDLVGGHIQMFFDLMPGRLPQISRRQGSRDRQCRRKRPAALPDLPTVAEQGLPGFDASSWVGSSRRRRRRHRCWPNCAPKSPRRSRRRT